ncbi:ParA family protein [Roseospira marina]|uniref:ParA family protein n=1 Tax=Roseospira marina TaxID=140057 RepID=A0A5M6I9L8_9PROT|nr:ParA family protein [Roseospira marina]KAA5604409.1 ParA family protein [Roseospira marina]MBB4315399.1 chromosome partitioning protein [Roseospira marina]MBB5088456.1 chromosome partitioning protein [Roseospira marina]
MNTLVFASISQKGGVGKSTIARLLATVYAGAGWEIKVADLNLTQKTIINWLADRLQAGVQPEIAAEPFGSVKKALKQASHYDAMIFDGAPDSHQSTLEIAKAADVIFVPSGVTKDDLVPQVLLANELVDVHKIKRDRIMFVLNKALDSQVSVDEARGFIERAVYTCAKTALPARTGYQRAQNAGRSVIETEFPTLNQTADALAQEMVNFIETRAGLKEAVNG